MTITYKFYEQVNKIGPVQPKKCLLALRDYDMAER